MSIRSTVQQLSPGALIELFELNVQGSSLYFHNGTNGIDTDIVWNGISYAPRPIEVTGFEWRNGGSAPRPTARVSNIDGAIGQLVRGYNDLIGASLTRRRTFACYLDAINFPGGVNPSASPVESLPTEVYYVARKAKENPIFIEFDLAAAFDVMGIKLPRRQVIQNLCPWKYRSAECGYTGGPVATIADAQTSDPLQDVCAKRLYSCQLRFGEFGELPYGGFPSAGLIR